MNSTLNNVKEIWARACAILKSHNDLKLSTYEMYFLPIVPIAISEDEITIGVSDDFFGELLMEAHEQLIVDSLKLATGNTYSIKLEYGHEAPVIVEEAKPKSTKDLKRPSKNEAPKTRFAANCHPEHSFDNFVVGEEAQFAYAAAITAAKTPGLYNPLFIYGGTGLGKTHLLQSIAHEYLQNHPNAVIEYIPCETLMNYYVDSLRTKKHWEFRNRFRAADILLVDDIQFLAKGTQIQEEFFNTFNTLYNENKQIILASDRPPSDINGLEARLVSRFEFGVTTEILPPSVETRMAILKKKQEKHLIKIDDDVLYFIATSITSNIRRLEGALVRLVAFSSAMSNSTITVEVAENLLGQLIDQETASRKVSIESIQKTVADHFEIKLSDILGKTRPKNIANPRMVAMYLSRDMTEHSLPEIGQMFGGRNHATVINAVKKIEIMCKKDEEMKRNVSAIRRMIRN